MQKPQNPLPISEYLLPDNLREVTDQLSDKALNHQREREKVNQLVINLVVKYLAAYMEIAATAPEGIQVGIRQRMHDVKHGTEGQQFMLESLQQAFMLGGGGEIGATTDRFGLESLIDTGATAAIVKEIIFNRDFDTKAGEFTGVDLGSGTGILTLAMIIAGQRSKARRVEVIGFEKSSEAIRKSGRLLQQLIDPRRTKVLTMRGDILDPRLHEAYGEQNPQMWVSETISTHTPMMDVFSNGVQIPNDASTAIFMAQNIQMDPFPVVVDRAVTANPQMYKDVLTGRTAMFPNVINGLYKPNGDHGSIHLKTGVGRRVKLNQIGQEFDERFEPIINEKNAKRFPVVDEDGEALFKQIFERVMGF